MVTSNPSALPRSPVHSSFPTSLHIADSQRAPSIISSRMTDIASEDGDEYYPEGAVTAGRTATGLPSGRPLNDPSRPPSAMSSQTRPSTRSPPSRRGVPFAGGWRSGGAFGGPGGAMSNTSRPPSAASRTSRTHVPSLASYAFFHPMSSQRLQAQRSVRPTQTGRFVAGADGYSEAVNNTNRQSLGSNSAAQRGPLAHLDNDRPPPSRGTELTDADDRATINASPNGDTTVRSIGESERPLQNRTLNPGPTHLDLSQNYKQAVGGPPPMQKSPRSFRAKFFIPVQGNATEVNGSRGHERLSSSNTTPKSARSRDSRQEASQAGVNYQYFSGNTVFCWGGRLQNTRDRPVNLATGIIVVIPSILFLVYSAPWLWHNVTPAIPICFAYILFVCISSLIHASVTDPGILPRNLHLMAPPEESEDPLTLGPPLTEWTMIKSAGTEAAAMDVPTKYCKTCNIWRPPRCHHCRVCDNCIETQDHHCIWLNNCVGRRNYRYFFAFVSTGTILGLFLIFGSLAHCLRYQSMHNISFTQSINEWRVPFAMMIYGILATPYPASLWGYHLYLTGRGETTREYLNSHKFLKKDRHRPFTQGNVLQNWFVIFLRPRPPTYLHFKRRHEDGDQRFGPRRSKSHVPLPTEQSSDGMEMYNVGRGDISFRGPATSQA